MKLTLVKRDSRICFGVDYYHTEEEAEFRGQEVYESGATINGGWMHGSPCGRARWLDHEDPKLGKVYAVITR